MAIIKISSPNPTDGTDTFSSIRFYEADDSSGTNATLLSTESVDTTTAEIDTPGFTTYTHTSGSTSKYYAARFYDTATTNISDYTTWLLGGEDRWDTMFRNEMNDTSNAVWSTTDVARFKQWALEDLYPDLFRIVVDTSLTLDNDSAPSYTYSLPYGMFGVNEVAVGDIDNSSSTFKILHPDNWTVDNDKLHLLKIPSTESSATIRLIGSKKYLEVGEVPVEYDRIVMHHFKMNAYLHLADDFPRYNQWAQLQEGTKVSFENLRVHAREFERKFKDGVTAAAKLGYASRI